MLTHVKEALIAVVVVGSLIWWGSDFSRSLSAPPATSASSDPHRDHIEASLGACEDYTRRMSTFAVGKIVKEYELTGKAKPNHYRVGFDYRTEGAGLLMVANCELLDVGNGKITLLRSVSTVK